MTSAVSRVIYEAKEYRSDYLLAVQKLPREVSGKLALKSPSCLPVGGHNEGETFSVYGVPLRISDGYRTLEIGRRPPDTGLTGK